MGWGWGAAGDWATGDPEQTHAGEGDQNRRPATARVP